MAKQKLGIKFSSLEEGKPSGATINGKKIALILLGGKVYALNAVCTHQGGPLDQGRVSGEELVCPWHGGTYEIKTGAASKKTPWVHNTETYKIEVGPEDELFIDV